MDYEVERNSNAIQWVHRIISLSGEQMKHKMQQIIIVAARIHSTECHYCSLLVDGIMAYYPSLCDDIKIPPCVTPSYCGENPL